MAALALEQAIVDAFECSTFSSGLEALRADFGDQVLCTVCAVTLRGTFFSASEVSNAPDGGVMYEGLTAIPVSVLQSAVQDMPSNCICVVERDLKMGGWTAEYLRPTHYGSFENIAPRAA